MSDAVPPVVDSDDASPPVTGHGSSLLRARLARSAALRPVEGRWAAVATVVGVAVAMAVVAAVFAPPAAAPVPGSFDGVPIPPVGAYSSSAFCSTGTGTAAIDTIYLTNSTAKPVTGVMTTVGTASGSGTAPTQRRSVAVPANGSVAVNPARGLPAGNNASTFVFDGGGVVASQVVSGGGGWSTAPCASRTSTQWSFAGGSTTAGNALALTLYNPAATEAVVNVSFLTSTGKETPQTYQGLVVPPGREVVENVGDFVQNASAIATFVTAQSGVLVSNEFQQWSSGATSGLSLQLGAPVLSSTWRFAQTTVVNGATVGFTLANPSTATVTASISLGLSSGSVVPRQMTIPPLSTSVFNASAATGLPRQVPYSVVVTSPTPIVVGRTVQAAAGATPPVWGGSAGTVTLADRWLVPGPGVLHAPGTPGATVDSLAVANPGGTPTRITVATPDGTRASMTVTIGPNSVVVLGPKQVGGISTFVVTASGPVNVEEDSGPSGSPGVVSSTGFPFTG
jgi:Family of unknown function (DUF5719)